MTVKIFHYMTVFHYVDPTDLLISDSTFVIHLVGVEKEADIIPLFKVTKDLIF